MSKPFTAGERILLVDAKGRYYLVTLADDGEFHTHTGVVPHTDLLGQEEGVTVRSTTGARYTAMRPTLSDVVLRMPRGAQVIYPKDLGPILLLADIHPGVRVLEAGVGSGALSMTMLRVGADIVGYELREDFAANAKANVVEFLGEDVLDRYRVEIRNVYDGIDERDLDRSSSTSPSRGRSSSTPRSRSAPAASSSPTRRRSCRWRSCVRPSPSPTSSSPRPSRSCSASGTSKVRPCVLITGWSPTRASSPRPVSSDRCPAD
jgi:hypothetical protein